ncbi:hypothetical protein Pmani_019622 [Petrolisthes manimaculis]|uniref:Uncharacterized protein n=1 Tax=Petrolisthes manimaculis TaxID=1843537 RepID=A0AAE1PII4_9EUCA|nr:hypothetical protein Pmani_019622 [Petrolisthes manimaculis]
MKRGVGGVMKRGVGGVMKRGVGGVMKRGVGGVMKRGVGGTSNEERSVKEFYIDIIVYQSSLYLTYNSFIPSLSIDKFHDSFMSH